MRSSAAQARQPCFQAFLLDLRKRYLIHTRRSRIGAGEPVRVQENIVAANFVVEHIEGVIAESVLNPTLRKG